MLTVTAALLKIISLLQQLLVERFTHLPPMNGVCTPHLKASLEGQNPTLSPATLEISNPWSVILLAMGLDGF